MAKKKSNSKAQDAENVVSSDDTTIKNDANVNEHDDAVSDSQDAPETQDAHETPGVGDGSEIQDSDVTETLCAEGGEAICDEVHRTTGKI